MVHVGHVVYIALQAQPRCCSTLVLACELRCLLCALPWPDWLCDAIFEVFLPGKGPWHIG